MENRPTGTRKLVCLSAWIGQAVDDDFAPGPEKEEYRSWRRG